MFVGDKVKCSSNLTLFVHVLLPDKDMGKVDDWGTELFFFRLIDWWTDINKRTLHYHFLILCYHPFSLLSSFLIFSAPLWSYFVMPLLSFCILHLSWAVFLGSLMKWRQVTPPKNIRDHGKNPPCHFLSTHSNVKVSMHMHARRHTHMHVRTHAQKLMRLLHTSFNT